VISIYRQ